MIQQTSINAFRELQKDRTDVTQRMIIFYKLREIGEATNKMLSRATGIETSSISARVFELRKRYLIFHSKTDYCKITGKKAMFWRCML
ncbi:winged helix-turn-helix domain-containing protein [Candidatus Pacearchaeota archaeon]|nr:winged helix-turn-helix domain-containing protein [Candidatus Pacearchaeota archaeon]